MKAETDDKKKTFEKISGYWSEISNRRLHRSVFYFLGALGLSANMKELFGFPSLARTFSFILWALFPMIVVLNWYHGEKGKQAFSDNKGEGIALAVSALFSILIFTLLFVFIKGPVPHYTIILPADAEKKVWLENTIINAFEKSNNVQINIKTIGTNYCDKCIDFMKAENDSLNILLAKVPLPYTGVLLNDYDDLIISFDDIYDKIEKLKYEQLVELKSRFDESAVNFGTNLKGDDKLYYLPAEFSVNVLAYVQPKVEEACAYLHDNENTVRRQFKLKTGYSLPSDYHLEIMPSDWDFYDLFVVNWIWKQQENKAKFAIPNASDFTMFSTFLDRALCFDMRLDQFHNIPLGIEPESWHPMANIFYWDVLFNECDLFYNGMWIGQGLSAGEIAGALEENSIYLSILPNNVVIDIVQMNPHIKIATLPGGVTLDKAVYPSSGFNNIWFYAVPKRSPSYELSTTLAIALTEQKAQMHMAQKFLQIPSQRAPWPSFQEDQTHGVLFDIIIKQYQINQQANKNLQVINPYKNLGQAEYNYLINYYHHKWWEIVTAREIFDMNYQSTIEVISDHLSWPPSL